jgi:hypothetical protein
LTIIYSVFLSIKEILRERKLKKKQKEKLDQDKLKKMGLFNESPIPEKAEKVIIVQKKNQRKKKNKKKSNSKVRTKSRLASLKQEAKKSGRRFSRLQKRKKNSKYRSLKVDNNDSIAGSDKIISNNDSPLLAHRTLNSPTKTNIANQDIQNPRIKALNLRNDRKMSLRKKSISIDQLNSDRSIKSLNISNQNKKIRRGSGSFDNKSSFRRNSNRGASSKSRFHKPKNTINGLSKFGSKNNFINPQEPEDEEE